MHAYICVDMRGKVFVHLSCAKTKVAPLKSLTIPKLELNTAVVLIKLVKKVTDSLDIPIHRITGAIPLWNIVLAWITTEPHLLKTFVSNRVDEIQSMSNPLEWRRVCTKKNPADLLSRGLMPKLLIACSLWWKGPSWLLQDKQEWPASADSKAATIQLPQVKVRSCSHASIRESNKLFSFEDFSDLDKLEILIAWCRRFKVNYFKSREGRQVGPLTLVEIRSANICLVKIAARMR